MNGPKKHDKLKENNISISNSNSAELQIYHIFEKFRFIQSLNFR